MAVALVVAAGLTQLFLGFDLAVAQQDRGNRCRAPDAFRDVGEKTEARKGYVAVLKRDPNAKCARAGLKNLNRAEPKPPSCREGDDEFDAGDIEAALTKYEEIAEESECAKTGIAAAREVQRLCDRGASYKDVEHHADSVSAYKAALEKNPRAQCASSGLEEARPDWFTRSADNVVEAAPRALVFFGLCVLAIFALALLAYIPLLERGVRRAPILRSLLGPRLTLDTFDDSALGDKKTGPSMTARVKECLKRMRDEAVREDEPHHELDRGAAGEEFAVLVSGSGRLKNTLSNVSDLSDQTKIVAAVLNLLYALLPVKRLAVQGVLEPPAKSGPAATLTLESDAQLEAATTLTGSATPGDPEPADYLGLADSAAVWVQYEVARVLTKGKVVPNAAESYALVREGLDRQLVKDYLGARTAYLTALELHPHNWAARVNLAIAEARLAKQFSAAIAILALAFVELEEQGDSP